MHLCTASELNLSLQHNKTSTIQSLNPHCFLHLCILGICRWDVFRSIKDLSWLELPLQHDWNVHNSVYELLRVSVPFGPLALVFALRQRLPSEWFGMVGTCVASHLTPQGTCHCAVPVRGTCLCLFTEMLSTLSIDCT